ncbi:MAG: hypothetical protein PHH91_13270 [Desulfuromonadaceae bacterium]|nr:hypothetical protein [Desulfuromonadaceae bacterium]
MEPITLCGAVIVLFGLWVEFEAIIMKGARAISRSAIMTALLSLMKEQRPVVSITPGDCRCYRAGSRLAYRMARS